MTAAEPFLFAVEPPGEAEPPGALRAICREVAGSPVIAFTEGAFRKRRGDRIAGIWFFATAGEARRVAAAIGDLLKAARYHVNRAGFSAFPADKIPVLVNQAMLHAGVRPMRAGRRPRRQRPWSKPDCARLGMLIGRGLEAKAIAQDPQIDRTPGNVQRQAHRLGLSFQDAPRGQVTLRLPREDLLRFERAALRRNLTPDMLLRRLAVAVDELAPVLFCEAKSDMAAL